MAKRILVADDSLTIQRAFAMTFSGEDVSLAIARSADEGLAMAQKAAPDLVIADGAMPGRTGYDLCASIRADASLRAVPCYILASAQQPYDETKGQRVGADGAWLKPWDTTVILDKVRDALTRGSVGAAPALPAPSVAPGLMPGPASLPASTIGEDDYGEISIDGARTPPPERPLPPPRMPAPAMPAAAPPPALGSPPAMRPSLIPGLRPGAIAPARPGTIPARPLAGPMPGPASPPPRPSVPPVARTMIGLPAAHAPIPGALRPSAPHAPLGGPPVTARPVTAPSVPLAGRAPGVTNPLPPSPSPSSVIGASVDSKLAAIAAKGPEYEAIAKLSREIIEQVVWEVVPELAEAIIRERLDKQNRV